MSEPITLYRYAQSGTDPYPVAGRFVERAWCDTHDSPGYFDYDRCYLAHERWVREADRGFVETVSDCVPSVRLVQTP